MNEDITFLVVLLALWYVFYALIFIMLFIHKRIFSGSHTFPGQSLLLSTNVLNDTTYYVLKNAFICDVTHSISHGKIMPFVVKQQIEVNISRWASWSFAEFAYVITLTAF